MQNQTPSDENLPDYLKGVSDKTKTIPLSQATPLKAKSKGKPVPQVYRSLVKIEWYRKFTLRERLAVLLGCNFVTEIGVATAHSPGAYQPLILGKVTYHKTPTDMMRAIVGAMLDDRDPKSPVVHEPEQKKEPEIF